MWPANALRAPTCTPAPSPEPATLSSRDREICEAIGPSLQERGPVFVGIDLIGAYINEIDITSPTGLQEIGRFDSVSLEGKIWDAVDARVAELHACRLPE